MPHRSPRTTDTEDDSHIVSSVPLPGTEDGSERDTSRRPGALQSQQNIQHIPSDGQLPPSDGEWDPPSPGENHPSLTSSFRDRAWRRAVGLSQWWTVLAWLRIGSLVMVVKPQTDSLIGVFVALYAGAVVVGNTPRFVDRMQSLLYRGQIALHQQRDKLR